MSDKSDSSGQGKTSRLTTQNMVSKYSRVPLLCISEDIVFFCIRVLQNCLCTVTVTNSIGQRKNSAFPDKHPYSDG